MDRTETTMNTPRFICKGKLYPNVESYQKASHFKISIEKSFLIEKSFKSSEDNFYKKFM